MLLFNLPFLCAVVLGVVFNIPLSYRCHTAQWCEGGPPSQETYWPQPHQPQQQEVIVAHPSATMQTDSDSCFPLIQEKSSHRSGVWGQLAQLAPRLQYTMIFHLTISVH